jgi:transcriptional regulator NrdR family protein
MIRCPECGKNTRVLEIRSAVTNKSYRKRQCTSGHTFVTVESITTGGVKKNLAEQRVALPAAGVQAPKAGGSHPRKT